MAHGGSSVIVAFRWKIWIKMIEEPTSRHRSTSWVMLNGFLENFLSGLLKLLPRLAQRNSPCANEVVLIARGDELAVLGKGHAENGIRVFEACRWVRMCHWSYRRTASSCRLM